MPMINVKLIEGVFNETQKKKMVTALTDAMVAIEGEPMRQVTWVVIEEVKSGNWAIGGEAARGGRRPRPPGGTKRSLARGISSQSDAARPAAGPSSARIRHSGGARRARP